jgi:hypothetical protein
MSGIDMDEKPATSLAEVDVHIRYLRRDLQTLLANMATKADIEQLARRMEGYATKDELARTTAEVARIASEVKTGSVGSTFDRWLSVVTRIGTAGAVVAGFFAAMAALIHFMDRVPK